MLQAKRTALTMEKKQKILYVITKGNFGGAQRYVFDLATNVDKKRFDVAVIIGTGEALKEKLRTAGIRVISLPSMVRDVSPLSDIKAFTELFILFRHERPDIVHLNSSKAGAIGSFAFRCFQFLNFLTAKSYNCKRGRSERPEAGHFDRTPQLYETKCSYKLKAIFTVHGFAFYEDRPFMARLVIKCISWVTIVCSHKTIVLNNRDNYAFSKWPFVKQKLRKINLGIANGVSFSKQEALEKLHRIGNIQKSRILLGTIAEMHKNKGLRYLIEALALLPSDVSLCIIGNGEERGNLEHLVQKLALGTRVFFAGFIDGASRYLNAFDIFVLPSIKEGTPYVLLEAGSAGLPVVASDTGGIGDVITDRKTGLLVQPGNSQIIASRIEEYLHHSETLESYGRALTQKVASEYSLGEMLEKTTTLYEDRSTTQK